MSQDAYQVGRAKVLRWLLSIASDAVSRVSSGAAERLRGAMSDFELGRRAGRAEMAAEIASGFARGNDR